MLLDQKPWIKKMFATISTYTLSCVILRQTLSWRRRKIINRFQAVGVEPSEVFSQHN